MPGNQNFEILLYNIFCNGLLQNKIFQAPKYFDISKYSKLNHDQIHALSTFLPTQAIPAALDKP